MSHSRWVAIVLIPLLIWLATAPLAISNDLTPEQVLRHALSSARAIADSTQRQSALDEVLRTAQRLKAVDFLMQMAEEAPEIRQAVLRVAVPLVAGRGRTEEAVALWRRIEDAQARAQVLAYACGSAADSGSKETLSSLLALAQGQKQRAQCLDEVVSSLLQADKPEEAFRYALQVPDQKWRSATLTRVADSLARRGNIALALQAASQIRGDGGHWYETVNMNLSLAAALAQAGKTAQAMERIKRAIDIVQRIDKEEGVLRYDWLAEIPRQMPVVLTPDQWKVLAARIPDPDERATFLKAACRRYAEEGQWQRARATVNLMSAADDRISALVMLSSVARAAGKEQLVRDLLRSAERLLPRVKGGEAREAVLEQMAVEMAAAGDLPRAVALAALVREGIERFNLLGTLLDEAKRRDIRPEQRPALQKLAQLCLTASAPEVPKEMGFHISLQSVPITRAGTALALAGDIEGVRRLMQRHAKPEEREGVLRAILAELSVERVDHEVPVTEYATLHWLRGGTMPENVPTDRHHALMRQLIDALAEPASRTKLRQEYLFDVPEPSDESGLREEGLSRYARRELAGKLVQAGRVEQAVRLALGEGNPFARASLLSTVVEGLLGQDRVDDALQLLREHNVLAYWGRSEVLQLLVRKGRYEDALQLVKGAPAYLDNPLTRQPIPVRAHLMTSLAKHLQENGQRERARSLLGATLQEIQNEPPDIEKVRLLTYIAGLLAGE